MKKKIKILIVLYICISILSLFGNVYALSKEDIYSSSAVVMDSNSSLVLFAKNPDEKVYPASTTKIITAILAIENLNLDDTFTATKYTINIPWDSSAIYLKESEQMSIKDLLYGLMLASGNDAANALAEAVSGNIDDFVVLMNSKAKEIGCDNTHFVNAHGYHDNDHYTTAKDMAKILNYCIKNQVFVEIASSKKYTIPETNITNVPRYLQNSNRLIETKQDSVYSRYYEYCIGGKTGYTEQAGRCLVSFGKKDDKTLVIATFGAGYDINNKDAKFTDAINLYNYCFENFSLTSLENTQNYTFDYQNDEVHSKYTIYLKDTIEFLNKNDEETLSNTYNTNIFYDKLNFKEENANYSEPLGTITFTINTNLGEQTITKNLYLKSVEDLFYISKTMIVIFIVVIVTIILVILLKIYKHKHPNKKRKMNKKTNINENIETSKRITNISKSRKSNRAISKRNNY